MSDDLIERLRITAQLETLDIGRQAAEAAAELSRLRAEVERLTSERDTAKKYMAAYAECDLIGTEAYRNLADQHDGLRAEVERLTDVRYRLAYAICGGEDFPGLLDVTSVEALVKIAREAAGLHMETIDRAMRAEAALSDERAHADALAEALTRIAYQNIHRDAFPRVAWEALSRHRARRQG